MNQVIQKCQITPMNTEKNTRIYKCQDSSTVNVTKFGTHLNELHLTYSSCKKKILYIFTYKILHNNMEDLSPSI